MKKITAILIIGLVISAGLTPAIRAQIPQSIQSEIHQSAPAAQHDSGNLVNWKSVGSIGIVMGVVFAMRRVKPGSLAP
jgi:hypothetical protein